MVQKTFNGWPVIAYPRFSGTFVAPNGKTVYTANPDVATIFKYVTEQWHERIEVFEPATVNKYPGERTGRIIVHGQRPYTTTVGTGSRSNHVSGTAMDVYGGRHPYERTNPPHLRYDGYDDGFSNAQRNELIAIRNEIGKNHNGRWILRLGIHFDIGWRDGMHVEIAPRITPDDVKAAAARLRTAEGIFDLTEDLLEALDLLGYDESTSGVREFQKDQKLTVDGIVGPKTSARLETEVGKAVDELKEHIDKLRAERTNFAVETREMFNSLEKRLDQTSDQLNTVGRVAAEARDKKVFDEHINFKPGTSAHSVFGDHFRAGGMLAYPAIDAYNNTAEASDKKQADRIIRELSDSTTPPKARPASKKPEAKS